MDKQVNEQADEQVQESENRRISTVDQRLAPTQNSAHTASVSGPIVDTRKRIQKQSYAAVAS